MVVAKNIKSRLKQLIRERTGNTLSDMQDAEKLSADMAEKKLPLSPHTLARLFGILKQDLKHYRNTYESIARFLGFEDWAHLDIFLKEAQESHNLNLHNASFPTPLFRLALISENTNSLNDLLDSFDPTTHASIRFQLANLLGNHIRYSSERESILVILSKHPQGQFLFFETYVDEDNPSGYYSKALERLYLPQKNNPYNQLFVICFLFTQQVYSEILSNSQFPDTLFTHLYNPEISFHLTSRLWECYFLKNLESQSVKQTHRHLDKMLSYAEPFMLKEKAWMFARLIRAFMFHKKADRLLNHKEYVSVVSDIINTSIPVYYSMAEFLIQALLLNSKQHRLKPEQPQFTPEYDYFNESHHKALLDSLTCAFLENNVQKKAWMYEQIRHAGKTLHKNWIHGFLETE